MSKTRIAINGMGRIGRTLLREIYNTNNQDLQIVAVNNPGHKEQYINLIKYDSIHGKFSTELSLEGDILKVGNDSIKFFSERDPSQIDWSSENVDIVIDATGKFKDKESLGRHLKGTVKKVIMCAPGKDLDGTFVMKINHESYDPANHHIVSNASCTTNCLAPVAKVLQQEFGIKSGLMTTVHSYTSDQQILDGSHKDPRRARAAALSMVPTTTGAAKAVGLVIPELKGKLDGYAIRVPTPNVSLVDLSVTLEKDVTIEEVNAAFKSASTSYLEGSLLYTDEKLVSIDYVGMRESSCVDGDLTNVVDKRTVKVVAWYDNEAGFSNRVLDLATYLGEKL